MDNTLHNRHRHYCDNDTCVIPNQTGCDIIHFHEKKIARKLRLFHINNGNNDVALISYSLCIHMEKKLRNTSNPIFKF